MGKSKKKTRDHKLEAPLPVQVAGGTFTPHPAPDLSPEEPVLAGWRVKQEAEVASQWAHLQDRGIVSSPAGRDYRLEDPSGIAADLIVTELQEPEGTSGKDVDPPPAPAETPTPVPALESPAPMTVLPEAPADPVLENRLKQPMIHYRDPVSGVEKVKGYTRVTTYIDGLDDKTTLTKWKMRTLLEGGALEAMQNGGESPSLLTVADSVRRTDAALADIDTRERVEGELLGLRRTEVLREHRDGLERIADDLMELGGAHEKANKGTNLHRLTELVDAGHDLPADTTASDRRDVEAYQAKIAELGIETLWAERRVVLDDIQVSGTMDRAYRVKLPGRKNRMRVVGDLKTGSVDWGRGKIGCQLALYSQGFGYDWTKPLERMPLSLSKTHGLLVHLPQGEGRCDVYVVDLVLAQKGLELARLVREWRRDQRRMYDLKTPLEVQS